MLGGDRTGAGEGDFCFGESDERLGDRVGDGSRGYSTAFRFGEVAGGESSRSRVDATAAFRAILRPRLREDVDGGRGAFRSRASPM